MSNKKKYYKVVYNNPLYGLVSANVGGPRYRVKYEVDKTVSSNDGISKLFVFKTLADAMGYATKGDTVYECEITNPETPKYMAYYVSGDSIEEFWKLRKSKRSTKKIQVLVLPGTVYVDTVKLTKQVWPEPTPVKPDLTRTPVDELRRPKKKRKPWWKFWAKT